VRIVFTRVPRGESIATIYVELPSFSRTHRVPHDLAHAVAERDLGLARGIFGSLAAGALGQYCRARWQTRSPPPRP